jgi:hypothetical protein
MKSLIRSKSPNITGFLNQDYLNFSLLVRAKGNELNCDKIEALGSAAFK